MTIAALQDPPGATGSTPSIRAAVYCRISSDSTGEGLGVARQELECRELADRLGWHVEDLYIDNDLSAYARRPRPEYRRMLADIRAGRINAILAWHTDRLYRRATDLEEIVGVTEAHGLQIETVAAGKVDLSTPSGRLVARQLGSVAQYEVEQTKKRISSQKARAAADGEYRGGPRPYGYNRDGVTIREKEAEVIRYATRAVLEGRSLRALARELNEQGYLVHREIKVKDDTGAVVKGEDGKAKTKIVKKAWSPERLRDTLMRPRNAGLLHHGKANRGRAEIVGAAVWPAIVSEDEWRAVYDLLRDPARKHEQGYALKWLGSGIYRCGVEGCGGGMRIAPHGGTASRQYARRYLYRCVEKSHLTIMQAQTDEYVRDVVAELVRDPRIVASLQPRVDEAQLTAHRQQRSTLMRRLEQVDADYFEDLIDARTHKAKKEHLTTQLSAVQAQLTEALRTETSSPVLSALDPARAFRDAPIDVQKAVLSALLNVEVLPATVRGAAWTKDRVRLTRADANS